MRSGAASACATRSIRDGHRVRWPAHPGTEGRDVGSPQGRGPPWQEPGPWDTSAQAVPGAPSGRIEWTNPLHAGRRLLSQRIGHDLVDPARGASGLRTAIGAARLSHMRPFGSTVNSARTGPRRSGNRTSWRRAARCSAPAPTPPDQQFPLTERSGIVQATRRTFPRTSPESRARTPSAA